MRVKKEFGCLASVLCALLVCALAEGATIPIPLGNSGWAMLIPYQCSDSVGVPAVDKVDSDSVVIELYKTFKNPAENGTFAPIIIDFQKISENAVPNIVIEDEYILNNTGTEWFDFHMYLLAPIGRVGFNPNFIPDGDQLESVSYAMYFGYQGLPVELDFANTIGGGVPSSPPGEDIFWPGGKSGRIVIATNPQMKLNERFSLKEIPTIPEPGTILLLGIGGWLVSRSRKAVFIDGKNGEGGETFLN